MESRPSIWVRKEEFMDFLSKKQKLISLKEAAKLTGYAPDYIGSLIRKGRINGKKVYSGVCWMTTEKDLKEYQEKIETQKKKATTKWKIIQFIYDVFPPIKMSGEVKETTKKIAGIKPYKSKGEKTFSFSWRLFLLLIIFLYLAGISPLDIFNKIVGALTEEKNTISLYSTTCNGDWQNPQNAQGQPEVDASGDLGSFYESNSAVYKSGSANLICQNFGNSSGSNPGESGNLKIQSAKIKFSFAIGEKKPDLEIPQNIDGGSTQNESVPEASPSSEPQLPPAETPPAETPPAENAPLEITPSVTGLIKKIKNFFSTATVKAQEGDNMILENKTDPIETSSPSSDETVPINESSATEPTNVLTPSIDSKIVVWYSLDNEIWLQLTTISEQPLSNFLNGGYFSFDAPFLKNFEDLKNLKIKFEGVIGGETTSTAYLDSVWVDASYDSADLEQTAKEEAQTLNNLEIKDSSLIIPDSKNQFSVNDEPTFNVTEPEMNVDDIISSGKGEIISASADFQTDNEKDNSVNVGEKYLGTAENSLSKLISGFADNKKIKNQKDSLSAQILKTDGSSAGISPEISPIYKDGKESFEIKIPKSKSREFQPGFYRLKIKLETKDNVFFSEQDFAWGVLAINTNKSIYLPGDKAYLQMAVLKEDGHTLCDANLKLEIISPNGETSYPEVQKSGECGQDNVTNKPDYFAYYQVDSIGNYQMKLQNLDNGYEINDSFEVQESVLFDIERIGPTRIYPLATYEMKIKIKANEDFKGDVKELMPAGFQILNNFPDNSNFQTSDLDTKILGWQVEFEKGKTYELKYQFDAPDASPYLYQLGPLEISNSSAGSEQLFQEARQWQIAADASSGPNSTTLAVNDTGVGTVAWTTVTNVYSSDTNYATAALSNSISNYIKATTFGFSIPAGNLINGIYVEVELKASLVNKIKDYKVNIVKGGAIGTTNRAYSDTWDTTEAYIGYGSSVDLWGETWTLTDINASNFGVAFSAQCSGVGCIATASVNHIRITVYYSPVTVSGNAYADEATTAWVPCDGSTANISLVVNGGTAQTTSCNDSTGAYSFSGVTLAANNPVSVFFNATDKGAAVTVAADSTSSITLNPRKNRVWVKTEGAVASITNTNLDTCDKNVTGCSNVPYSVDSGVLTIDSGTKIVIETGKTFAPGGNITAPAMEIVGTYTASSYTLTLSASGTNTTCTNDAGTVMPLCINGGTFSYDTSSVNFTSTADTYIAATTYYNLYFYPTPITSSIAYTATGAITVTHYLDMSPFSSSGTPSLTFNLGGTFTNSATTRIKRSGGSCTAIFDTTGSNYGMTTAGLTVSTGGTLNANGSTITITNSSSPFVLTGTFNAQTSTVIYTGTSATNIKATTYNNLNLGGAATTTTYTAAGDITVTSVLTIVSSSGANTFDASTRTITLSGTGTPFIIGTNGVFTYSTSTIVYSGATTPTNVTSTTYYNLNLGGAATTTTYTAAGDITVTFVLTIVSSSGTNTFDASSRTITLSGIGTPFVNNETFTPSTSTVKYTGNDSTNITAASYNNLELLPSANLKTFTLASGTINTNGYLTIGNGTNTGTITADTNDPTLNVDGAFTIAASGTFIASNSGTPGTFTIAGNFSNSGTFTHSSGTVTFDDVSKTTIFSGSTTFYNFTCNTASKALTFTAGTTQTIAAGGALTLNGQACNTQIVLRSSSPTNVWNINVPAPATVSYVDVQDSTASGSAITANNSTDSLRNTNWTINACGITISGNVYSDEASTKWPHCDDSTENISLVINGGTVSTTHCHSADGSYSFTGKTVATDQEVAVFMNATHKGIAATVAKDASTAITLNPIEGRVWVKEESTTNITNTLLHKSDKAVTDCSNVPYTISDVTNALTVDDTYKIVIETGKTFVPDGNVTTPAMEIMASTATYTAGSYTLTLSSAGSGTTCTAAAGTMMPLCIVAGGVFTASTDTVIYSTATGSLTVAAATYNNLTLSNTSGTDTAGGVITVNTALTTTSGGTLDMDTFQLLGVFTPTNGGTLKTSNATATPIPASKTWAGTVEYGVAGGGQTIVSETSYNNLTLDNTSGTDTAGGNLVVNGTLTTTAGGTLDMTAAYTLSGTLGTITNNGTISTAVPTATSAVPIPTGKSWGGTIIYAATAGAQTVVAGTYNNLTLSNTSGTDTAGGDITVTNVLTTTASGVFDASDKTITLSGTGTPFVKNGTFTANASTVKYTGDGATNITAATYYNLELSPTITDDRVYTGAGAITVGGTLNINPSATAKSLTFNLGGTTSVTGATTIQRSSTATSVLDTTGSNHSFTTGSLTIKGGGTLTGNASALDSNGDVTIEASGTLTSNSGNFNVGGSWLNSATGTFTHSSGTVIFDATTTGKTISDGGDAFYNLQFTGASGGWTYTDGASTAPNATTVNASSGTATFINAKTGTSPTVSAGTLNVDWYLGVHVADAVTTTTHIDTGDADITISEKTGTPASTVWRYSGGWGSGAASQTTGTDSNGNNPQPTSTGAILIREYSNISGATTYYLYNLHIAWQSTYGEYDYYSDYGSNYLTSTANSGANKDAVIGVDWYRATVGTMNAVGTINEPPTTGSWYCGMLAGLSVSIDSYSVNLGTITPGAAPTDATNVLTITTSATNGYVVTAWSTQAMTCSDAGTCASETISDWTGTNASPTTWSSGSYGFGYSTNDYALLTGTADRFSGPKFAAFSHSGSGDLVADRSSTECPCSSQQNTITYRIAALPTQRAGPYSTTIVYVVTSQY